MRWALLAVVLGGCGSGRCEVKAGTYVGTLQQDPSNSCDAVLIAAGIIPLPVEVKVGAAGAGTECGPEVWTRSDRVQNGWCAAVTTINAWASGDELQDGVLHFVAKCDPPHDINGAPNIDCRVRVAFSPGSLFPYP